MKDNRSYTTTTGNNDPVSGMQIEVTLASSLLILYFNCVNIKCYSLLIECFHQH